MSISLLENNPTTLFSVSFCLLCAFIHRMLNGRNLTTFLVIVFLLNPCRIDGERIRGTRDRDKDGELMAGVSRQTTQQSDTKLENDVAAAFEHAQHHHLHERQLPEKPVIHHAEEPDQVNEKRDESSLEDEDSPERHGEKYVEVPKRQIGDGEDEQDGYSGDESHIDVRDIHYHIHRSDNQGEKTLKERKEIDPEDEDGYVEFSGEDSNIEELHVHDKETSHLDNLYPTDDEDATTPWEHFKMHLHSHRKEDGEFGYITDEEEVDSEGNDDETLSGEQDYDHEHIKTLHVHRRVKQRDGHVVGRTEQEITGEEDEEYEDEQSGEEDFNAIYDPRDWQKFDDNELDESAGSVMAEDEEEDEMGLSGEEDLSVRDEEKITVDNDGEKVSQDGKGEGKEMITENSKEGPDSQKKNTKRKNKLGNKKNSQEKNIFKEKLRKLSLSKKKGSSIDSQVTHRSQHLKVHAEIDLTHKKTDVSPKETAAKKKKARSFFHKARNDKNVLKDSETGQENGLKNAEDFYIDESGGPKRRMFAVEMRDAIDGNDQGKDINPGSRKINRRSLNEDGGAESIQRFRRGNSRHLLQFINMSEPLESFPERSTNCTHPALADTIPDQTIVYIRAECRLCQCKMDQLICNAMPEHCDQQFAKTCPMTKGELTDGETHFDGCNKCVCRNGELLCTRVRCSSSNYNYTNYRASAVDENTLENQVMAVLNEGVDRGKDWCMECDSEPVSPVCGPNWKTYRSTCHAFHCGGFNIEDIKQGKCENLHPCDGVKCAEHEICIADRKGPCLATITRDGDIIECSQHICVSPGETSNCSSAVVEKVCGEDQNSYINKCQMFGKGVALAYCGSCREECLTYDSRMCGVDGVTFKSICHASRYNSHLDYPGQCDEVEPKNNVFSKSSAFLAHFNFRCQTVTELARCPEVNCVNRVIPEGSCCPICGTAVSIRLDTAARDMISLNANVQPPQDLNRIDFILVELKNLSDQFGGLGKCQLTIDLVDTHDVSVVYKPIRSHDDDACQRVAMKTVEFINSPDKSDQEPAKALLAVAVIKERENRIGLPRAESLMKKWRMKRGGHHEHEPFYNKSDRIRLQNNFMFLTVLMFVLVYKLKEF